MVVGLLLEFDASMLLAVATSNHLAAISRQFSITDRRLYCFSLMTNLTASLRQRNAPGPKASMSARRSLVSLKGSPWNDLFLQDAGCSRLNSIVASVVLVTQPQ